MLRQAEPAQQLKRFIRKYAQLDVRATGGAASWPIPARSIPCIEFTFGDPYRIRPVNGTPIEFTRPAMLVGAKTRQKIRLEPSGRVESFTVLFQPTGLQRLVSLPAGILVDEHYEADSVLGAAFASLHSQLEEAQSFAHRLVIADGFFSSHISQSGAESGLDAALGTMISRQGHLRMQDLADGMGISLRHFQRRFADRLGISPKLYARILRFEAALHKKSVTTSNWTVIAHELGYFDQAHMIHDFQILSNDSPSQLTDGLELLHSLCADSGVESIPLPVGS